MQGKTEKGTVYSWLWTIASKLETQSVPGEADFLYEKQNIKFSPSLHDRFTAARQLI